MLTLKICNARFAYDIVMQLFYNRLVNHLRIRIRINNTDKDNFHEIRWILKLSNITHPVNFIEI